VRTHVNVPHIKSKGNRLLTVSVCSALVLDQYAIKSYCKRLIERVRGAWIIRNAIQRSFNEFSAARVGQTIEAEGRSKWLWPDGILLKDIPEPTNQLMSPEQYIQDISLMNMHRQHFAAIVSLQNAIINSLVTNAWDFEKNEIMQRLFAADLLPPTMALFWVSVLSTLLLLTVN
jgi:hypothetical protein